MVDQVKLKMPPLLLKGGIAFKQDDLAITVPFNKVRKLRLTIEFPQGAQSGQAAQAARSCSTNSSCSNTCCARASA